MLRMIALLICALLLGAHPVFAKGQGYEYTFCEVQAYDGQGKRFFLFSMPFPALPLEVGGLDRRAEASALYEQGRQEFKRYILGRGLSLFEDGGPRCNPWPPDALDSREASIQLAKDSMASMAKFLHDPLYSADLSETEYTDFVPSFAAASAGDGHGVDTKPPTTGQAGATKPGIQLSSGPTPEDIARNRREQIDMEQKNLQDEQAQTLALQQAFELGQEQEAQQIRERVENFRRDYDRRQAACTSGDTANCYSNASKQ